MAQMTCPICGSPVIAGMIYCDDCGFDLRQAAPAAPIPAPSQTAADSVECPVCGHINRVGAVYCGNCGAALTASPPVFVNPSFSSSPLPVYQPAYTPPAPISPKAYLMISATNARLELPESNAELIIGREDEISGVFPDIDLEPYGAQEAGVSRRHLKIWCASGSWMVEDLNTVNGTFLNRRRIPASQPTQLKPGDELRLGKLVAIFTQD